MISVKPRAMVEWLLDRDSKLTDKYDIISICDPECDPVFEADTSNVLTLAFHDIDRPKGYYVIFSSEMANKVIDFLLNRDRERPLIVHCTAGVSRSGAVASFARQLYGLDFETFNRDNPHIVPNSWVSSTLHQEMSKR